MEYLMTNNMKHLTTYKIFEARIKEPKPKTLKKANLEKLEKGVNVGYVQSWEIDEVRMLLIVKFIPEMNERDYLAPLQDIEIGGRKYYSIPTSSTPGFKDSQTDKYNAKMTEINKRYIKAHKSTEGVTYNGKLYKNREIIGLLRHNSEIMQRIEAEWDYHPYASEIELNNGSIGFLYHDLKPDESHKYSNNYSYKLTKSGKIFDTRGQGMNIYNSKPLNDFSDYEKALYFLDSYLEKEFLKKVKEHTKRLDHNPFYIHEIPTRLHKYFDPNLIERSLTHDRIIQKTSKYGIFDLDNE